MFETKPSLTEITILLNVGKDPSRRRTFVSVYIRQCQRTDVMIKSKFTPEQKIQTVVKRSEPAQARQNCAANIMFTHRHFITGNRDL